MFRRGTLFCNAIKKKKGRVYVNLDVGIFYIGYKFI